MEKPMDYAKIGRAARGRSARSRALTYALLSLWALMVLFPFYWMLLSSFKSYGAYNSEFLPKFYTLQPTLQNYVDAFTAVPLGRYFLNTLLFTAATAALMLVVVTLAAFEMCIRDSNGSGNAVLIEDLDLALDEEADQQQHGCHRAGHDRICIDVQHFFDDFERHVSYLRLNRL